MGIAMSLLVVFVIPNNNEGQNRLISNVIVFGLIFLLTATARNLAHVELSESEIRISGFFNFHSYPISLVKKAKVKNLFYNDIVVLHLSRRVSLQHTVAFYPLEQSQTSKYDASDIVNRINRLINERQS